MTIDKSRIIVSNRSSCIMIDVIAIGTTIRKSFSIPRDKAVMTYSPNETTAAKIKAQIMCITELFKVQ